jgi:hydrogenase maturation protease
LSAGAVLIGLGNIAQTDDGIGVHAIRRYGRTHTVASQVDVIEGGTAGLLLIPALADAECAIIVDAIDLGATPGTFVRLPGAAWTTAFAQRLSPHDTGLTDLLGAALLTDALPRELVLMGLQPGWIGWGTELTPPVATGLPVLVDAIADQLAGWGFPALEAAA